MSIQLEDAYVQALDNLPLVLQSSYERMKLVCSAEADFNYSNAIAERLRAFYTAQLKIKRILNKKVAQAGSDFFVETILFFLKLFADVKRLDFEITSERAVQRKRNAMRPDISIWRGSELVAVIECKTQLGWSRNSWEKDFEKREQNLRKDFPKAKMFLVMMSSGNWPGFRDGDSRVGKQLFCLLNKCWPTQLSTPLNPEMLDTPIEKLFEQIQELGASNPATD